MANERQIKLQIQENAELMAKSLAKGKDIEIRRTSNNNISVREYEKKIIIK